MKATLIKKIPETSTVTTYQFQPADSVEWQAGQFIEYHLPQTSPDDRGESRYFTISSAPYEEHIQITTRLDHQHGSTFKSALDELNIGDEIEVSKPMGEFVVDNPQAHYVFIAGGIGITPFHSILLDLAHRQQPIQVALLYANRDDEVVFKDVLEKIAAASFTFTTRYYIGDQRIQLTDITAAADQFDGEKVYFYISGPEPMVGGYTQQLSEAGVEKDQIITDYFPGYND